MSPATAGSCGACCTKLVKLGVAMGGRVVLEEVDLHLHCGELTAVVGPNGAGKTTLLRAILGEVPRTGHVHFLDSGRLRRDRPAIGYVPQKLEFDATAPMSVMDLFASAGSNRPSWLGHSPALVRRSRESLAAVDAEHLRERKLGNLSGGELQRVLLALAITPAPDLLLLDEPVTGIDMPGTESFHRMISGLRNRYHLSVILVSHDLAQVARHADRVVYLNRKVIVQGTAREVLSDERVKRAFGIATGAAAAAGKGPPRTGPESCVECTLEGAR